MLRTAADDFVRVDPVRTSRCHEHRLHVAALVLAVGARVRAGGAAWQLGENWSERISLEVCSFGATVESKGRKCADSNVTHRPRILRSPNRFRSPARWACWRPCRGRPPRGCSCGCGSGAAWSAAASASCTRTASVWSTWWVSAAVSALRRRKCK